MIINNREFDLENKTYVMGILNVTPDSFSDGGKFNESDKALKHVEEMIEEGVDIVDVGGESTRPGFTVISNQEEIERTSNIISLIRQKFDIPVSIDTYKPEVAREAVKAGAGMINDIQGLHKILPGNKSIKTGDVAYDNISSSSKKLLESDIEKESEMANLIAETGVACCLMHNRQNDNYSSFLYDIVSELDDCVKIAKKAGIKREQIILDPGFGFPKTYEQNMHLMKNIDAMSMTGFPLLVGTSRKSFIGKSLDLTVDKRMEGTLATTAYSLMKTHIAMFRVHDVKENVRLIRMLEAIKKA